MTDDVANTKQGRTRVAVLSDAMTAAIWLTKKSWAKAGMGAVMENQHGDNAKIAVGELASNLFSIYSVDELASMCPDDKRHRE